MPKNEMERAIADEVPWSDRVTAYHRSHHATYLRLIDATEDGATNEEMSRIVLGIDPVREPDRAARSLASHLKQPFWMVETGYKDLLDS